ncbi:MAG: phage tail sheath subtilisin-like domain-containing protein [Oscillibacter sp.]|nr:phage tail sheath subtilisin-like domain-containing protein [Oscillibacter sp.]
MGTFSAGETKIRPGVYHRFENAGGVSLAGANNGIVAGIVRANWGPLNEVMTFDQSTKLRDVYGSGQTQDLITAMMKGGANTGYFVRVGTGGTCGSVTLKDTGETAVGVVKISAKFPGDRAFSVTIKDSLTDTSKRQCVVYDGTSVYETREFAKGSGEPDALAAAFALSKNFTAEKLAAGSGLMAAVTQAAFTAGTNPTVTTEAYSEAMAALEPYAFNVFCVDTEDRAVHALVQTFVDRLYESGSYPMAVLSEKNTASNTVTARMNTAKSYNDSKVVYVLNGGKDADGNVLEGYINAARIGGIVAAVPSNQSVTHYVVSGYASLSEPLTNMQIIAALQAGCMVLSLNTAGQVWIEQGINTLVTPSGEEDEGWKKIRRVKTRFELMQRIDDTVDSLVGRVNNDTDGRAALIAAGNAVIERMISEKKLRNNTRMYEDTSNPPQGSSAWFVIAVDDIDSIEIVYLNYRFRFAATDE